MEPRKGTDVTTEGSRHGYGRVLLGALVVTALFASLLDLAGRLRQPILVDIGPSTGRYGSGFEDSEETPPTTSRWTRQNAGFDIPLSVEAGPARFSIRAARYVDGPTQITLSIGGKAVTSFEQPSGRQRIQSVDVPLPEGPLNLGFRSDDPNLGMALDWIRIENARWRVPWKEWTAWILPAGLFFALLVSGCSLGAATAAAFLIALLLAAAAAVDPFGFVHVSRDVAAPAVLFSLLAALLFRGQPGLTSAIAATMLLKGAFLFHPSYFYNDVRQNDRYVGALRSYEGSVMERSRKAQVDLGVGYPRIIAGKKYAFPYSPIFYLPFTLLPPDRDIVVRAIKHVALFATVVEVAVAFCLARLLMPAAAGAAAWLTFAFPILTSRMLYAMWSTLAGHALDLLVVLAAVWLLKEPRDRRAWLGVLVATLATFLTYVSSLFNTSAFLVALALIASAVRWRVIALWLVAAVAVIFGLYGDFTVAFVREILPAVLKGSGQIASAQAAGTGDSSSLTGAFSRIVLFAGYGFPVFAVAGAFLIHRQRDAAGIAMRAYVLAFLALVSLRGLSGGLFKDLKEIEYAGPAFGILSAVSVVSLPVRVRWLIVTGLVLGGVVMQYGHFERWSRLVLG